MRYSIPAWTAIKLFRSIVTSRKISISRHWFAAAVCYAFHIVFYNQSLLNRISQSFIFENLRQRPSESYYREKVEKTPYLDFGISYNQIALRVIIYMFKNSRSMLRYFGKAGVNCSCNIDVHISLMTLCCHYIPWYSPCNDLYSNN